MGVIEEEKGPAEEGEKDREEKDIGHIKSQTPFPSLFRMISFFHDEKESTKKGKTLWPGSSLFSGFILVSLFFLFC